MKIPRWKQWLSYFMTLHLEHRFSEYNQDLHILLSKGRFQLCTSNAVYSYDDLYSNFVNAFEQLNIAARSPQNVLLLGLGLGSIPYMLEKKYKVNSHYTAVDIDETVVELAHKYTLSSLNSSIEYVVADAAFFVSIHQEKYDLICVDIFKDVVVPPAFEEESFLVALAELLNPKGIVLYNRLSLLPKDKKETKQYYNQVFKKVFPDATYFDVTGNWVLSSSN